jgi:hypothetical protein
MKFDFTNRRVRFFFADVQGASSAAVLTSDRTVLGRAAISGS